VWLISIAHAFHGIVDRNGRTRAGDNEARLAIGAFGFRQKINPGPFMAGFRGALWHTSPFGRLWRNNRSASLERGKPRRGAIRPCLSISRLRQAAAADPAFAGDHNGSECRSAGSRNFPISLGCRAQLLGCSCDERHSAFAAVEMGSYHRVRLSMCKVCADVLAEWDSVGEPPTLLANADLPHEASEKLQGLHVLVSSNSEAQRRDLTQKRFWFCGRRRYSFLG